MADCYELRLSAVQLQQGEGVTIYAFGVDGKQLPLFAAVARVGRDNDESIRGYQRPEVVAHIRAIRDYVETKGAMLPNSIVVAFDDRVRFEPARSQPPTPYCRNGVLVVPVDESWPDHRKPGWIVDGQQRTAAIREARVDGYPVMVNAFITTSEEHQRSQFILVNSTKPLPKGLIYELLPTTRGALPTPLERKRFPSYLLDRLNYDRDSPFRGLIRTPTTPDGVVKDNSVLKMLENSLYAGALYAHRDPHTGEGDVDEMLAVLKAYWKAVREAFPDAWGLLPRRSRLMHGVGIVSMGFVMDDIAEELGDEQPSVDGFTAGLAHVVDICRWTSGYWCFDGEELRRWNDLQNVPRDIQALSDHLVTERRRLAKEAARRERRREARRARRPA